jgi:hypothetical protein
MSGTAPLPGRRIRFNPRHESWELIWTHVHRTLVVNLAVAAGNLPLLVALHQTRRPWHYPVFFAVLALTAGPSLAAAFGYLRQAGSDERAPAAVLLRCYRRTFRRALAVWACVLAVGGAAAADALWLRRAAAGPAAVPALLVVVAATAAAGITALASLADPDAVADPDAPAPALRAPHLLLAAAYACLRRPHLTLLNLALAAAGLLIVNQAPMYGLATVPGCVLFVLWRNAQAVLRSAHEGARPGGTQS